MNLQELVQQRNNVSSNIMKYLQDEVVTIKLAAEEMIECATNIKGQGYSLFIRSREEFLEKIDGLQQQLEDLSVINTNTRR